MMVLSRDLIVAIKLSTLPAYKIAQAAGLDPSTLSKLLHGITPIKPMDKRILRIGKLLGLAPEDCFDESRGLQN